MSQQQNQPEKHNIKPAAKGSKPDDIGSKTADIFDGVGKELWARYVKPGIIGLLSQMWHGTGDYIYRCFTNGGTPPPIGNSGQPSYKYGRNNYGSYYNNNQSSAPWNNNNSITRRSDRVRRVNSWADAQNVKNELLDALEAYPNITISDFYAATPSDDPKENELDWQIGTNWGWDDISGITFKTTLDGKVDIIMPTPKPLNR